VATIVVAPSASPDVVKAPHARALVIDLSVSNSASGELGLQRAAGLRIGVAYTADQHMRSAALAHAKLLVGCQCLQHFAALPFKRGGDQLPLKTELFRQLGRVWARHRLRISLFRAVRKRKSLQRFISS